MDFNGFNAIIASSTKLCMKMWHEKSLDHYGLIEPKHFVIDNIFGNVYDQGDIQEKENPN